MSPDHMKQVNMELPTLKDLDKSWRDYAKENEKLVSFRRPDSQATQGEVDRQTYLTESLLQEWINKSAHFKGSLCWERLKHTD